MSKSKFIAVSQQFGAKSNKALELESRLEELLDNIGFDKYFVTFSASDGVLLANKDGDQWVMTNDVVEALYGSKTEDELLVKLNDPKRIFQI